ARPAEAREWRRVPARAEARRKTALRRQVSWHPYSSDCGCCRRCRLPPLEFPGGVDNLFLQLGQFLRLAAALLTASTAAFHRLAFTENLVERPDFGEEHVAGCPPQSGVRANVIGPNVVSQQLVRPGGEVFERQE